MSETLLHRRTRLMGEDVPTFYDDPLHIVRGEGVFLWDDRGRKYLDCYNNTAHVGHCHPHVVQAIHQQARRLNTHTRYVSTVLLDYLDRLTATFSHDLSQVLMCCTGSEANDVAMRMAQAATGRTGFIATDDTYHGNTAATSALSTRRPPIGGYPPNVRLVRAPSMTNPLGGSLDAQPEAFARGVRKAAEELAAEGHGLACLILCPIFANEGFLLSDPGFLAPAEREVRAAGGLILCDEVQPGFGRAGQMWGHDVLGLTPDIVTLGKPMANGHPVAAVVTRPDVMSAFRSKFGYFNTFGGNPVSAAAAAATLDVLEREDLIGNARRIGYRAQARLAGLDHPYATAPRASGAFFGIEFRLPNGNPATAFTHHVVNEMRRRGVLVGSIGRGGCVLKMRPPLQFTTGNVDFAVNTLEDVLKDAPL